MKDGTSQKTVHQHGTRPNRERHSARLLAKEIAAKESPEDIDTDHSVVVDDGMTMSESRAILPPSDWKSCRSSIEKPMDIL